MSYPSDRGCPTRIDLDKTAEAIDTLRMEDVQLWFVSAQTLHKAILRMALDNPERVADYLHRYPGCDRER